MHSPRMAEGTVTREPFPHRGPHSGYGHYFENTDLSFYLLLLERDDEAAPKGTSSEKKSASISFPGRLGMAPFAPLALGDITLLTADPGSTLIPRCAREFGNRHREAESLQ